MVNKRLHAAVMEVIDNQLRDLDPPETKETYDRLLDEGYPVDEVRRMIGCVVVSEIFEVLKKRKPYDHDRYVSMLKQLPDMPWDIESL